MLSTKTVKKEVERADQFRRWIEHVSDEEVDALVGLLACTVDGPDTDGDAMGAPCTACTAMATRKLSKSNQMPHNITPTEAWRQIVIFILPEPRRRVCRILSAPPIVRWGRSSCLKQSVGRPD